MTLVALLVRGSWIERGTDGSAVVWAVAANGADGSNGTLRAYTATPDANGLLQLTGSDVLLVHGFTCSLGFSQPYRNLLASASR